MDTLEKYHQHLIVCNYAKETKNLKMYAAKHLLVYLEEVKYSLSDCDASTISEYCASAHFENRKPGGVSGEFIRLRHFLKFVLDNCYISRVSVVLAVPTKCVPTIKKITVLNTDEVSVLQDDFTNHPSNLRSKAIYLLALDCGLRTVDINNLTFSKINFDKREISLIQLKTNVPHTVPLSIEASNALIDYLIKERRQCDLDNIFISSTGPIKPLNSRYSFELRFSNQEVKPSEFGLHILRRTFATRLLRSGVELPMISSALGRIDKDIVHKYLSVDSTAMKRCALEIDDFPLKDGRF